MDKTELKQKIDDHKIYVDLHLQEFRSRLMIDDKILDKCLADQVDLQVEWENIFATCCWLYNVADTLADEAFAAAFKRASMDRFKDLSSTECKYYATADTAFIDNNALRNEIYGLKKKVEGNLKTVESRKFMLKDIASLVIDGSNKHII